jgi:hypothetical protein
VLRSKARSFETTIFTTQNYKTLLTNKVSNN